jgi:methylisocitrate lyase
MGQGQLLRQAWVAEKPLQIVGCMNAYVALLAKRVGYRALYLSGAGVANNCYGLPDLGLTTLEGVLEEVRRITSAVDLPLLVDIDTGWGNELMIERAVREIGRAGAAGVHIEDQVLHKRCGHRPNKRIVPVDEMVARVKAAVDAKVDADFVVVARTDALASEGLEHAIERAISLENAGADVLFPEAVTSINQYKAFRKALKIPILANMTEFGKTPLLNLEELAACGIDVVLYPLSADRAMHRAALAVLEGIRRQGTQQEFLEMMETRSERYEILDYLRFEHKLDRLQ